MKHEVHIPGIPDDAFTRGDVPMTKEEIRALTLCKAKVQPEHIVYDIGAGTGSITVEAALMARLGKVYAIERDSDGIQLININAKKFGIHNIEVIHGEAPEVLTGLPDPDVVIVGGSGGNLAQILDLCNMRLKSGGKIVVNAVTLETLCHTQTYFAARKDYRLDITCLSVTKALPAGASHLFRAHNPVYIIAATKEDQYER
jgi:precorrin-6Y C5,15-methyltransferase (decarboxylating) CbiT subunit